MRQRWLQARRIDRPADEAGSIALEASLIMPVFLLVFIFLILIIRAAMVQMALQDAVSQTVRLTAAHMYPVQLVAESVADQIPGAEGGGQPETTGGGGRPDSGGNGQPGSGGSNRSGSGGAGFPNSGAVNRPDVPEGSRLPDFAPLAAELLDKLPEPAGPLVEAALHGDWQSVAEIAAAPAGDVILGPLIRELAAESALDPKRIRVARLSLPDLTGDKDAYLRVRLAYDMPLVLPFTRLHMTLLADAEERVWIADPVPAPVYGSGDEGQQGTVTIISIEPAPLRPGRKAKLTAMAEPNTRLTLEVWYKSGKSRAKNLGELTTDEHGIASWEWHVSGNTTPGMWNLRVTSEDGAVATSVFLVQKAR